MDGTAPFVVGCSLFEKGTDFGKSVCTGDSPDLKSNTALSRLGFGNPFQDIVPISFTPSPDIFRCDLMPELKVAATIAALMTDKLIHLGFDEQAIIAAHVIFGWRHPNLEDLSADGRPG